jgi:hypothetical protein
MTKILSCAVVVGLLVASSSSVFARGGVNNGGSNASQVSPGHEMNSGGTAPVKGLNGAAGWAPGHQTSTPTVTAPGNSNGAAVYAPGFLK